MTGFGAAVAAAVPLLQGAAQELMQDQVRIVDVATFGPADPVTSHVDATAATVYAGPARVKPNTVRGTGAAAGQPQAGARDTAATYVVSVPIAVTGVKPGHRVKVLAAADQELLQRTLVVRGVEAGTQLSARRLLCEIVQAVS